jgi:hypothetical protein
VAERDLSGITCEQIEADRGDDVDAKLGSDEQRIGIGADKGGEGQRSSQHGDLQRNGEGRSQRHRQTVRALGLPNRPCGRISSTPSTTMKITASW